MKRVLGYCVILFMVAVPSLAANPDGVYVGTPAYGGSGCPAGSASVVMTPDSSALSLLFDSYVVDAGRSTGRSMNRKTCNIAIPVHVPQGYTVAIFKIDYRGFNQLPYGGYSTFNVEYFFAGSRGPAYTKRFVGPLENDYVLTNTLQAGAVTWAPCGQDVILRTNTSMVVNTPIHTDALSTVDSMDVGSGVVYHLQWMTCRR